MAKYRKKPVVVEAFQFHTDQWNHGNNRQYVEAGIDNELDHTSAFMDFPDGSKYEDHFTISTLEGINKLVDGEWVITGIKGEHYNCKPDIFEKIYDKVSD